MELPSSYVEQMKMLLGENYPAYQDSFSVSPAKGLRVNELKISVDDFLKMWTVGGRPSLKKIPWTHDGFYLPEEENAAKLAFYAAGLYYLSDPSAMGPAEFLPVRPGDRVLDLCASPGGKTVELAAKLKGQGLLYSNDISASRAKILKKNMERHGIANAYVTAEDPKKLAGFFRGFFDAILVDAPCSGEGMFRSQPSMVRYWEEHGPEEYAPIQQDLLEAACAMLAPGGFLVYSTCTFSPMEDEDQVLAFLARHGDMEACPLPSVPGFSHLIRGGEELPFVRFYPHRLRGEGQFAALLRKKGDRPIHPAKKALAWARGEEEYLLPASHLPVPGLHYLMTGLHTGTRGKYRFEPSQAFAMALCPWDWPDVLPLAWADPRVAQYLRGETLLLEDSEVKSVPKKDKKDTLVTAGGYPLGFGRRSGVRLKNLRPAGWI